MEWRQLGDLQSAPFATRDTPPDPRNVRQRRQKTPKSAVRVRLPAGRVMVTGARGVKHGSPTGGSGSQAGISGGGSRASWSDGGPSPAPWHRRRALVPAFGSARMTRMSQERPCGPRGWFHMTTSDQYRTFAEECERLARRTEAEHRRAILLEMAKTWRMLADESDRKNGN